MKYYQLVIAGAGIGGLSASLFLARAGHRVTLIEQASELTEAGAGIQIGPNAMKVLSALELADLVLQTACQPQAIAVRDAATGRNISRMLLGAAAQQRYGQTYCTLHRADLQAALLQAVRSEPLVDLQLGTALASFAQQEQGVQINLLSGSRLQADALLGADGLWSRVRAQLLNDGAPRATGHAAFRALLPTAAVPHASRANEVGVWWGRDVHVLSYPVRSGAFWNVAILAETQDAQTQGWSLDATAAQVRLALGKSCQQLSDLIDAASGWKRWNLFDRPSSKLWGQGAVSLLGDAAHPMLPYLAQGAAMALEDAAVLAKCVQTASSMPQALRAYEKLRMPRTQRVVNTARRNGRIFHLRGPLAVARDAVLALKGTEVVGLPWLYGYDASSSE